MEPGATARQAAPKHIRYPKIKIEAPARSPSKTHPNYREILRYESKAKVFVSLQSAANIQDFIQGDPFTQQATQGYAEVAVTPIVLDTVIDKLDLTPNKPLYLLLGTLAGLLLGLAASAVVVSQGGIRRGERAV